MGSDEAGVGPWAGPLVVCAVSGPIGWDDPQVDDSKKLSESQREDLCAKYSRDNRFIIVTKVISVELIDKIGIYNALIHAHSDAISFLVRKLAKNPFIGVVDGTLPVERFEYGADLIALPKADSRVPECALASIFAKTQRDHMMVELDKLYPGYGFASNNGYRSPEHEEGLKRLGPCPAHRTSYAPIAEALASRDTSQIKNAWEMLS